MTGQMSAYGYPFGGMYGFGEDEYTWEKVYDDLNMDDWFDNDLFKYGGMYGIGQMANQIYSGITSGMSGNNDMWNNNNNNNNDMWNNNDNANNANDAEAPEVDNDAAGQGAGGAGAGAGAPMMPAYSMYGYGSPYFYDTDFFNNDWWDVWDDAGNSPRVCNERTKMNDCHGQTQKGHCVWNMQRDSCVDCASNDFNCLCTRFDKAHGKEYCIQSPVCAWSNSQDLCLAKPKVQKSDRAKPSGQDPMMVDQCTNFFDHEQCFGLQANGKRCFWNAFDGECIAYGKRNFDKGMCGIHADPERCANEWRGGIHFSCVFQNDQCLPKEKNQVHGGKVHQKPAQQHHSSPSFKQGGKLQLQQTHSIEAAPVEGNNWNTVFIILCVLLGISTALNTVAAYHFCHRSKRDVGLLSDA